MTNNQIIEILTPILIEGQRIEKAQGLRAWAIVTDTHQITNYMNAKEIMCFVYGWRFNHNYTKQVSK